MNEETRAALAAASRDLRSIETKPRANETPSEGLKRQRAIFGGGVKYAPHRGERERYRNLRRLARMTQRAIGRCSVCDRDFLLDDLGDLPSGRLACLSCLHADATATPASE